MFDDELIAEVQWREPCDMRTRLAYRTDLYVYESIMEGRFETIRWYFNDLGKQLLSCLVYHHEDGRPRMITNSGFAMDKSEIF